ncbi:MAG: DUF4124 domain-containing protein [Thiopseudomonas sp.]|nr:DUF4124 domain-containing protein [Thiopseudomonas sp.]
MKTYRLLFVAVLLLVAAYLLFPSARSKMPSSPAKPAANTVYYKWQDDKGVWNLSDQPPQGIEAQQGVVNPNTNIIQSPPAVAPAEPKAAAQTEVTLPGLHYVERAGRVLEDAREARDALNGRQQQLDALSAEH